MSNKARRSGKKNLQMTKNQRRKAAYVAMSGFDGNKSGTRSRRNAELVHTDDHQAGDGPPCSNIGCKRCRPVHYNLGLRRNGFRAVEGIRNRERSSTHHKS